jgi:large subunit ribosomal protein L3
VIKMEFLVEKIGMSRTVGVPSFAVTLVKVLDAKVCEVDENGKAIVAYSNGKKFNKAIEGMQKKYNLSKEYNRFAELEVANTEAGDLDVSAIEAGKVAKVTFKSKGRGFSGVIKRHGFAGGPGAHGSRFHRAPGSIGMCECAGRVQPGQNLPGHY